MRDVYVASNYLAMAVWPRGKRTHPRLAAVLREARKERPWTSQAGESLGTNAWNMLCKRIHGIHEHSMDSIGIPMASTMESLKCSWNPWIPMHDMPHDSLGTNAENLSFKVSKMLTIPKLVKHPKLQQVPRTQRFECRTVCF